MTEQRKVTWLVSFSHFITHGYMTLFPAVMGVIAGENSLSFMGLGIIANIGYFLYGLGAFPAGYFADKYGSKRVLTLGIIGMAFSAIAVGLSSGVVSFGIAYAFLGTFASIHHPAGLSFLARRVTERKGKALGVHGVMGNVGLFFTPLFAAFCVWSFKSWRSSYLICGIIGIVFAYILNRSKIAEEADLFGSSPSAPVKGNDALQADSPSADQTAEEAASGFHPAIIPVALLLLYLGSMLSGFIFRGALTFMPTLFRNEVLFVTNHDEPVVIAGYLTTAVLSLGLVGAWFGGWVNDKLKKPEFLPGLVLLLSAPLLYYMSSYYDNQLIVVSAFFSLIYYAWQPAQNYLIAKYTKKASHGMGFGANFFLIFGLGSIATTTGGWVTDDFGVDRFYWFMSIVSLTAAILSCMIYFMRSYRLRLFLQFEKEK